MKLSAKKVVPATILVAGVGVAIALMSTRPRTVPQRTDKPAPLVRVIEVAAQDVQLFVSTQGTVVPRTEIHVVPEVSGRVVYLAPSFRAGGFFRDGDVLVRIDPREYEAAVATAGADVAQAGVAVAQELAEAEVAGREWKSLGRGPTPPLVARVPQLAQARARRTAAEAALDRARLDLERTEILAPFDGRVRMQSVGVGEFVQRGGVIGEAYATDIAEIRLPFPDSELAYVDLPLDHGTGAVDGPDVVLVAEFAGAPRRWHGRIVRTEGELDPSSRMVHAIAQVEDPYGENEGSDGLPLAAGMFVEARVSGHRIPDALVLPRSALRGADTVLIVDHENRLRFRQVTVLRTEIDHVIVTEGLTDGEKVCVSPIDAVVDGMSVRTLSDVGTARAE